MDERIKNILVLSLIGFMTVLLGLSLKRAFWAKVQKDHTLWLLTIKEGKDRWSYEIYEGSTLLIRQEHIPAIGGQYYFSSRKDAETIGNLVLEKLLMQLPPTITTEDLVRHQIIPVPGVSL